MSTKTEVLNKLIEKSNEYISGESLANELGKSRAAVWKAIKTLQKDGFVIDAVTNKGYRLGEKNDILTAEIIKSKLANDVDVIYYPSIDSTNTEAKRLLLNGKSGDMLLVANEQTAGRGRQGKSFYSPALTGIYMSYVCHPMTALENAVTATTATAVAVCRAIEKLTDKKPKIKWVNDVYLDGKKICGILTEAITDFETQTVSSIIIGIGMNVKTKDFPNDIEGASCLDADIKRCDLIAGITDELCRINSKDYGDFITYYREHSMILGERIDFIQNGKITSAKAIKIDSDGGLVVKLENGETTTLRSGEISVRKKL